MEEDDVGIIQRWWDDLVGQAHPGSILDTPSTWSTWSDDDLEDLANQGMWVDRSGNYFRYRPVESEEDRVARAWAKMEANRLLRQAQIDNLDLYKYAGMEYNQPVIQGFNYRDFDTGQSRRLLTPDDPEYRHPYRWEGTWENYGWSKPFYDYYFGRTRY